MSVLITGASGFVGRVLAATLLARRKKIRLAVRGASRPCLGAETMPIAGSGNLPEDWHAVLNGCDSVIHLAARAHVLDERAADPLSAFRQVNVELALAVAKAAADAGARRFVFVSSIGVHGNHTTHKAFEATDGLAPNSPYATSKMEAEQALRGIARATGMELAIVRPPLVYGPHAPGNFGSMMRALQRGIPLPLASVADNRRSFVAIDNLVDLLITCIDHPSAANQTFLVSDGEDLSTVDLLRRLGRAMGHPTRLFPMPPSMLQAVASLLGKRSVVQRLLDSLQVDITHTRQTLGWAPPVSVDEGLRRAAAGFRP